MRTIAFLSGMNDFTVGEFINSFQEAQDLGETDVLVRLNTGGGSVMAGYSWIMTVRDFEAVEGNNIEMRVEGRADSMGAFSTLFVNNTSAIEQSTLTFHRAEFPEWMNVTDEMQSQLDKINSDLRSALEAKVDADRWKSITGTTIRQMFNTKQERINVTINARQARKLGILKNVVTLSPVEAEQLNSELIAASIDPINVPKKETKNENKTSEMTVEEIKANHPEAYEQIVALGVQSEKDRVEAWLEFKDIDSAMAITGVVSGKNVNQKDIASFAAAGIKKGYVDSSKESAVDADTTPGDDTPDDLGGDTAKTESEQRVSAFEEKLDNLK